MGVNVVCMKNLSSVYMAIQNCTCVMSVVANFGAKICQYQSVGRCTNYGMEFTETNTHMCNAHWCIYEKAIVLVHQKFGNEVKSIIGSSPGPIIQLVIIMDLQLSKVRSVSLQWQSIVYTVYVSKTPVNCVLQFIGRVCHVHVRSIARATWHGYEQRIWESWPCWLALSTYFVR